MPRSSQSHRASSVRPLASSAHYINNTEKKNVLPVPAAITSPKSSFTNIVKEGIGFGIGQSIAHRVVGSVLGLATGSSEVSETKQTKPACHFERNIFEDCIRTKSAEYQCSTELHSLEQCIQLK